MTTGSSCPPRRGGSGTSAATILRSVEGSLERPGIDRIDILYLHDPDNHWESASTEGVNTLIELRDQGVVAAIGAGMNQSVMLTSSCDAAISTL